MWANFPAGLLDNKRLLIYIFYVLCLKLLVFCFTELKAHSNYVLKTKIHQQHKFYPLNFLKFIDRLIDSFDYSLLCRKTLQQFSFFLLGQTLNFLLKIQSWVTSFGLQPKFFACQDNLAQPCFQGSWLGTMHHLIYLNLARDQ